MTDRNIRAIMPPSYFTKRAALAEAERDVQAARAERLAAACRAKDDALIKLAHIHHCTRVGSKRHDPERLGWMECPCESCRDAYAALTRSTAMRESASDA